MVFLATVVMTMRLLLVVIDLYLLARMAKGTRSDIMVTSCIIGPTLGLGSSVVVLIYVTMTPITRSGHPVICQVTAFSKGPQPLLKVPI